jgi:hypothetical protein
MVRRWSRINNFNIDIGSSFFFIKKQNKLNLFKTSVNFKKFKFKYTKFKRKSLTRIKHSSTFLVYTNIFKFWSKNYIFNKHLSKAQYAHNVSLKNIFFYNFNFIKNKNENIFYNLNFLFLTLNKKKYLQQHKNCEFFFFKNTNITFGWSNYSFNPNSGVIPAYSQFDFNMYPTSSTINNFYDYSELFYILYLINIQKYIELYKVLLISKFI